jgi:hypothetical protein
MPSSEDMACCVCGNIQTSDEPYETEILDGEEFPICPKCENHNVGGYSSFAPLDIWPEEDRDGIIELHKANLTQKSNDR